MPGVSSEVGKLLFLPAVNQVQREGQFLWPEFCALWLCAPFCFQQTGLRAGEARDGLEIAYLSLQADDCALFTPAAFVPVLALFKLLLMVHPLVSKAFSEHPSVFVPYGNIRAGLGFGVGQAAPQLSSEVTPDHSCILLRRPYLRLLPASCNNLSS